MPDCPAGHELSRWRNRIATLKCDGACGAKLSEGTFRWSCNLCDFDICDNCVAPDFSLLLKPTPRSSTPLVAAPSRTAAPLARQPACRPSAPSAARNAPGATPSAGAASTPALATGMGNNNLSALLHASQGLESVKRDLSELPGSARPAKTSRASVSRVSSGEAAALGFLLSGASAQLPRHERPGGAAAEAVAMLPSLAIDEASGAPPALFDALPPLAPIGLPLPVETRMLGRREWLQELLGDELSRAVRASCGEPSALELACGVPRDDAPVPARATAMGVAAVLLKFEHERASVLASELTEIYSLQAMGKCRPPRLVVDEVAMCGECEA